MAERVFVVPELLEYILLQTLDDQVMDPTESEATNEKEPVHGVLCPKRVVQDVSDKSNLPWANMKHLFTLQRVNTTFAQTIIGSPELRRRMLLRPFGLSTDEQCKDPIRQQPSPVFNSQFFCLLKPFIFMRMKSMDTIDYNYSTIMCHGFHHLYLHGQLPMQRGGLWRDINLNDGLSRPSYSKQIDVYNGTFRGGPRHVLTLVPFAFSDSPH